MINQTDIDVSLEELNLSFAKADLTSLDESIADFRNSQKKQSRPLLEGTPKWGDLAKKYCKEVLEFHTYEENKKKYDEEVYIIKTDLKFKNSEEVDAKYIFKSKKQLSEFCKQWYKSQTYRSHNNSESKKKQQTSMKPHNSNQIKLDDVLKILSSKPLAPPNHKDQYLFKQFLEMVAPDRSGKHSWDLKILGQYQVRKIDTGGLKNCLKNCFCRPCQSSDNFIISITNESIIISEQEIIYGEVQEVIPFTYALKVEYAFQKDSYLSYLNRFNIAIISSGKTEYTFQFQNLFDLLKFCYTFNRISEYVPYFDRIKFQSFSPPRENNWTKFYNNGQNYFADLHDQIQKANHKICITGWCITPYLLLKRPQDPKNGSTRLDNTLLRAANRGVKIFILVFKQPKIAINNDSENVWKLFSKKHKNFKVLRHPEVVIPKFWSHHEKSVIIDQKVAFMGGLDICYGRWDTDEHPIYDKDSLWPGADYNNERQKAITQPKNYMVSNLDKNSQPRMGWADIAMQAKGPIVIDLQRHFVQYWYFAIQELQDDARDCFLNFKNRYIQLKRYGKSKKTALKIKLGLQHQQSEKTKINMDQDKRQMGEMQNSRIQHLKSKSSEDRKDESKNLSICDKISHFKQSLKDLIQNKSNRVAKEVVVEGFMSDSKLGNMRLQLCRSSCEWSTGIKKPQHSIYNAYLHRISKAKKFIYIENQFFMSNENEISQVIAERIKEAFKKGEKFKIIVMLPLLPGFQGDPTSEEAPNLRTQMFNQYKAIDRHKSSIARLLLGSKINLSDYIHFVGARNHGLFGPNHDKPETQIIYIHSKFMIVDDKYMIIGSANINDRSLLGQRDSELAMVIQDPDVDIQQGQVGSGEIFDFRCRIFSKFFGMSKKQCQDLDSYWDQFIKVSKKNTQIYRNVFGCYPDNMMTRYEHVKQIESKARRLRYHDEIKNLRGFYVQWPRQFLKEENLNITTIRKEALIPAYMFS